MGHYAELCPEAIGCIGEAGGAAKGSPRPNLAEAETCSGPRICAKPSLCLLSCPSSFVLHLPAWRPRPFHILQSCSHWAVSGLWTGEGLGPPSGAPHPCWQASGAGRGPELSLPGHSPTVSSTGQSCSALSLVGRSWRQRKGRAQTWPEALCCQGPMCLRMEPTLCMEALGEAGLSGLLLLSC